jgi:acetate kinase
MKRHILCVNSGSSSMKFALYLLDGSEELVAFGEAERIGLTGGRLWLKDGKGKELGGRHEDFPDHGAAVKAMFSQAIDALHLPAPDAVGHRVVMGGPDHYGPEVITPALVNALRKLIPFMPLHLPGEIKGIEGVAAHYPGLPQAACFDTAFHRRMPEIAKWMPLPRGLWHEGIHRYGFHGLSYEYIVSALGDQARGRGVIAHLGNGASMAAVRDGMPVDTTMAFSPMGGLMMGTRCGDLDPGVITYLMYEKGYTAAQLEALLGSQSGLLGVSGLSPDMKTLLDKGATDPHAFQAVELFCYVARKFIGAMAAALGGLDLLVFTGGIGERAAPVRWAICSPLEGLGVEVDPRKNDAGAPVISKSTSPCTVRVIPTDEDLMIARHTRALLFGGREGGER